MASGSPSSSPDTATGSGTDPARPDTGEPLGGAGSDSDSDLGLNKFDCSAMEMGEQLEGEELELEFESAADRVKDLLQIASRDQLLYLYARYKQVKVGKCNTSKPGFFDFEGQRKWQAWKQLGDMEPEQAMREYISLVNVLDPEGATKQRRGAERRTGFGGAAVSSLYQEEMIREEDKNIFDYCRENNIEHIRNAISSQKVDVNTKDEEGRALLHWACDRGHKELVSVLLQHKADINSQDNEGQTALHYASACEFADIVELLLNSGADPSIKDMEGSLPEEVTESSAISSLLRQYTAPKG
ncbi:acyl-CoA-binding domain-containing protein 6 isoform X1 [Cyprinodon tularosa]|uniref:Acyl-CoA-binding domain-containing protein 6 n=2 Tax=Cyprinodontoidei TaxID=8087 RepID=A0A3Q2DIN6_CYPVA|nr:PREDICTED: acyl-CoA-binding domain-containing protein 6 isoform X1 [Cyprinodon variegatus]XP_038144554.1 acyl-CoA-binding domain-containing protein 6 isoform X1 [Cyprinodon tularosa]